MGDTRGCDTPRAAGVLSFVQTGDDAGDRGHRRLIAMFRKTGLSSRPESAERTQWRDLRLLLRCASQSGIRYAA